MLFACTNDLKEVNKIVQKDGGPYESTKNVELFYSDSGFVAAKLNAPQIDNYNGKSPYSEFIKGVKLIFFSSAGEEESELSSNYAIKRTNEGIMEAKGNVKVINKKGEMLNTEQLFWNEQTHKIYSPTFCKITTKDEIIYGDGFESNEDFSHYKILKIKGIINLKDEQTN